MGMAVAASCGRVRLDTHDLHRCVGCACVVDLWTCCARAAGIWKQGTMSIEDGNLMKTANKLLKIIRQSCHGRYIMRWTGTKNPHGATISGIEIKWAQHGRLTGPNGIELGFYRRTVEFEGHSQDQHAMIVSTNNEVEVIAPDGSLCRTAEQGEIA